MKTKSQSSFFHDEDRTIVISCEEDKDEQEDKDEDGGDAGEGGRDGDAPGAPKLEEENDGGEIEESGEGDRGKEEDVSFHLRAILLQEGGWGESQPF